MPFIQLDHRNLLRLAEKIHRQLGLLQSSRFGEVIRRTHCLIENQNQLRRDCDLLAICLGRNWNAAAGKMTDRILSTLRDLPYYAGEVQRIVESAKLKSPPIGDILADLRQAHDEFEEFKYVEEGELLVVTTDVIELEGYYLGQFEIQLRIGNLAEMRQHSSTYRIVALDPHPAACNDSVTHPHVSDEHLCEGDAGAAIESALTNGRICDFFHLVNAVLTTYNPGSPYVALADWEGRPCYDCGYTMNAGAEDHYLSAAKKLLDTRCQGFQAVTAVRNSILAYWRGMSLPYPEPGIRLIRQHSIEPFNQHMTQMRQELVEAVEALDRQLPDLKEDARRQLGELYNPADYPPSLRDLFAVEWDFPSVEPPEYLLQLNPRLYEQQRQLMVSRFEEAVQMAEQAFAEEFGKLVAHLTERLTGADDGKPKVFRDSVVGNLQEFFERFRSLNVRSNEELDRLVETAQRALRGVAPHQRRPLCWRAALRRGILER